MRALEISGPDQIAIIDKPNPFAGPGELLLATEAVGLCHTDVELAKGTMIYIRQGLTRLPLTPGHEWVARVAAVGDGVANFSPGDLVVGECSVGCGNCDRCRSGNYHQCADRSETGIMRLNGAMAGLFVYPARSAHKLRPETPIEDAVFAEPAAVALRAVLRGTLEQGQRVLVTGGGTIGWLIAAIAMDLHGVSISIAEPEATRMKRALDLGCIPFSPGETFDVVFEASGHPQGIQTGLNALAPSGRMVAVGLSGHQHHPVDIDRLVVSDQTVTGSLGSPGVWEQTLSMLGRGRLRPSQLVTGRYALGDAVSAYRALEAQLPSTGKLLIIPTEQDRLERE